MSLALAGSRSGKAGRTPSADLGRMDPLVGVLSQCHCLVPARHFSKCLSPLHTLPNKSVGRSSHKPNVASKINRYINLCTRGIQPSAIPATISLERCGCTTGIHFGVTFVYLYVIIGPNVANRAYMYF